MQNTTDILDAPMHQPETDYHFSFGSYFTPQFKIIGVVFVIIGISLCVNLNFLGLIFILAGLIALIGKKELSISYSLSKYRYALSVFNMRWGKWISMPQFESISIFSAKKSQVMSAGSQSQTAVFSEIEVNLVYNRSRRLTVFTSSDYNKSLITARLFASKFSLDIYDATSREGKWLD